MLAEILITIISVFSTILLIQIVLSLLYSFNVIPHNNQVINNIYGAFTIITAPVLNPVRRIIPDVNGIDFSPIVVFIVLDLLQSFIARTLS